MDELELPEPTSLIDVKQELEWIVLVLREGLYWDSSVRCHRNGIGSVDYELNRRATRSPFSPDEHRSFLLTKLG